MEKITPPEFKGAAFTCPHCEVFAHQYWYKMLGLSTSGRANYDAAQVWMALCTSCSEITVWSNGVLVDPEAAPAPMPNADLSDEIKADYLEARSIVARSPRGAAALLRLCIQKLCIELDEPGKDLNKDIGALVKRGLLPTVQKMLDAVRVIGNNAVHPGEIDLNDTPEMATALFGVVNAIADQMITRPREVQALYDSLPTSALEGIERRDEPSG